MSEMEVFQANLMLFIVINASILFLMTLPSDYTAQNFQILGQLDS